MIAEDDLKYMIEHFDLQAKNAPTRYLADRYDQCRRVLREEQRFQQPKEMRDQ